MVQPLSSLANWVLSVVFVFMVALPLILQLSNLDPQDTNENRELADMPDAFEWAAPNTFAKAFDAYYQDHFGWRSVLIKTHARFMIIFGISPSDKVLIGSDGWLFYTGNKVVENYRRLRPYKQYQLERTRQHLEAKRDWLKARGIDYLYVVAPDKHTIYPEHIPARISTKPEPSRLDQLVAYLDEKSDFKIVDLRQEMFEARNSRRLYHKTDTHWNLHGARIGYNKIAELLEAQHPQFSPTADEGFDIYWEIGARGDLGDIIGIDGLYEEERVRYKPKSGSCGKKLSEEVSKLLFGHRGVVNAAAGCETGELSVLMFRDSYGLAPLSFMRQDFKRIEHVSQKFSPEIIEDYLSKRKTDVVIELYVERMMVRVARPEEIEWLKADSLASQATP